MKREKMICKCGRTFKNKAGMVLHMKAQLKKGEGKGFHSRIFPDQPEDQKTDGRSAKKNWKVAGVPVVEIEVIAFYLNGKLEGVIKNGKQLMPVKIRLYAEN